MDSIALNSARGPTGDWGSGQARGRHVWEPGRIRGLYVPGSLKATFASRRLAAGRATNDAPREAYPRIENEFDQ